MQSARTIQPKLVLLAGKYAQPPNLVFKPSDRKTFKVEVSMMYEVSATTVLGSPANQHSHLWTVLDENFRQVMVGEAKHGSRVAKSKGDVTHTVMAGAENPDDFDLDFTAAKLKDGGTYMLICQSYGVAASLCFTVVAEPKRKAAGKKKATRKAAPKKKKAVAKKKK